MSESLREGSLLDGRYRLLRPLGEGGMGSVWVAEQLALRREVAVKVLLRVPGPEDRGRLRMEALALAAVRHPAVVQVFDYGEAEENTLPYIVMELVHGELLSARLPRMGAYPAREAVALMLPLLEGLEAAHRAGVIHRDIKPSNVLVCPTPERTPRLKLLDFGIARLARSGAPRLTAAGSLLGTPENMAPEQVRGRETDVRTDVWGAGLLLYEMIAGQNPFFADDVFVTMRRVMDSPPAYPLRAAGLNGGLWRILTSTLRKGPEDRPPSAIALRSELQAWLEGASASTRAPSDEPRRSSTLPAPPDPAASGEAPTLSSLDPGAKDGSAATDPSAAPPSIDALIREKLRGS